MQLRVSEGCRGYGLPYIFLFIGILLPWLIPLHVKPWASFHAEVTSALVFAIVFLLTVATSARRWSVPRPVLPVILLAAIPIIQYAVGYLELRADAGLPVMYLLGFALVICLGRELYDRSSDRFLVSLYGAILLSALVSTVLLFIQWTGQAEGSPWIIQVGPGQRLVANVAQSNNLATLLVWGLVAVWWFYMTSRLGAVVSCLLAALLLFGLSGTQSRIGALMAFAGGFAAAFSTPPGRSPSRLLILLLSICFFVLVMAWPSLTNLVGQVSGETWAGRLRPGTRINHWALLIHAVEERPLLGWGWQQVVTAQSSLANQFPATNEVVTYSHNALLDLAIWNGLPITMIIVFIFSKWLLAQCRKAKSSSDMIASLVMLLALLGHAMVEFPYAYANFLLPLGVMIGGMEAADANFGARRSFLSVGRVFIFVLVASVLLVLGIMVFDYIKYERATMDERIRRAGIISPLQVLPPTIYILDNLDWALQMQRSFDVSATGGLEALRRKVARLPSASNLYNLSKVEVEQKNWDRAAKLLEQICRTQPERICDVAQASPVASAINDR